MIAKGKIKKFKHEGNRSVKVWLILFASFKETKCTYNIHSNIVFYHSNMFGHYSAIFRGSDTKI